MAKQTTKHNRLGDAKVQLVLLQNINDELTNQVRELTDQNKKLKSTITNCDADTDTAKSNLLNYKLQCENLALKNKIDKLSKENMSLKSRLDAISLLINDYHSLSDVNHEEKIKPVEPVVEMSFSDPITMNVTSKEPEAIVVKTEEIHKEPLKTEPVKRNGTVCKNRFKYVIPEDFLEMCKDKNNTEKVLSCKYGVSRSTIDSWKRQLGAVKSYRKSIPEDFKENYNKMTYKELCKLYNISHGTVSKWVRELNLIKKGEVKNERGEDIKENYR